jgi:anaerobic ribonucleoside-triphosphate reductase activating protein
VITTNLYPELFPDLSVAEMDVVEGAAGPGRRLVIWLQGCLKRCPGCANGPFLPENTTQVFSAAQIWSIVDHCRTLDGLTLSGGEPILQAAALLPLLKEAHQRNLTTVCYSGYELEELIADGADPVLKEFVSEIDLLIDGEYRQELPSGGAYRPTENQRLHFLSGRISAESVTQTIQTDFYISGGRVTSTGTLPVAIRRIMAEKLRAHGIILNSTSR